MEATVGFDAYSFSTDALPERDRLAAWREVFARELMRVDMDNLPDRQFRVSGKLRQLGEFRIQWLTVSGARVRRTPALLDDGCDDLTFLINLGGDSLVVQRGREIKVGTGEAVVLSAAEPATTTHCYTAGMSIVVPREALVPLVRNVDDAVMRLVPHGSEALRLLIGYLGLLDDGHALAEPSIRDHAIAHVRDLAALALATGGDARAVSDGRAVRAARLHAVKAHIKRHAGDCNLSLAAVAHKARISPGYVRKLFASEGTSFTDFVLEQRLGRAHHMLRDPGLLHLAVSTIAFDAGFGDLSYFNRAFRRRYGATPSGIRAATLRDSATNVARGRPED